MSKNKVSPSYAAILADEADKAYAEKYKEIMYWTESPMMAVACAEAAAKAVWDRAVEGLD